MNVSFSLENNVHWSPGYTQLVGADLGVQLGLEETPIFLYLKTMAQKE